MAAQTTAPTTDEAPTQIRWSFIDALRGVSIVGILFVNIPDITRLGYGLGPHDQSSWSAQVLNFGVQARFVPIFTFLFGLSLVFVVRSAWTRGRRPWLALLCRLAALLGIGVLHALVYPGEILREYALTGLLVLPLIVFTPRLLQLVLGSALTVTVYALYGGGLLSLPGLMLLGAAAAAYRLPHTLNRAGRQIRWACAAALLLAGPAVWWQTTQPGDPRFTVAGGTAGLILAVGYVTGLSLLWSTRVRAVLSAVFEPIGRMALSNYVGASLISYPLGRALDFTRAPTPAPAVIAAVGILAVQSLLSRAWLSRFRYGPLEWVWRIATWRQPVPLTRHRPGPAATLG